jgi:hypothetical protein
MASDPLMASGYIYIRVDLLVIYFYDLLFYFIDEPVSLQVLMCKEKRLLKLPCTSRRVPYLTYLGMADVMAEANAISCAQ